MTHNKTSDTELRIVEAAARLFSEQGFKGTSTREIARAAEVNETSLFRYFPRKQELFWAAVDSRMDDLRLPVELQDGLEGKRLPARVVPLLMEFLMEVATRRPELVRLLYFGLMEMRPHAERICREKLGPMFAAISDYWTECAARGAIRELDPEIVAVGLVTVIMAHQGVHKILKGNGQPFANAQQAAAAYSSFWLQALAPEGRGAAGQRDKPAQTASGG